MCTETYTRFRPCNHTAFQRWKYGSVIIPADRLPETGRACRKYKMKYKESSEEGKCLECAMVAVEQGGVENKRLSSGSNESTGNNGERVVGWIKGVFGGRGS